MKFINHKKNTMSYLKYVALMTQSGTNDPTIIVLENTIGNIIWTRDRAGSYLGTLAGAFPLAKTWYMPPPIGGFSLEMVMLNQQVGEPSDQILIETIYEKNNSDGQLYYTPIEIRVYP